MFHSLSWTACLVAGGLEDGERRPMWRVDGIGKNGTSLLPQTPTVIRFNKKERSVYVGSTIESLAFPLSLEWTPLKKYLLGNKQR